MAKSVNVIDQPGVASIAPQLIRAVRRQRTLANELGDRMCVDHLGRERAPSIDLQVAPEVVKVSDQSLHGARRIGAAQLNFDVIKPSINRLV
jgi:hypothetical protein